MKTNIHNRSKEFFLAELHVSDEDMTSLHNAFRSADAEFLLDALIMVDPAWRSSPLNVEGRARQRLLNRVKATLDLMYEIEPLVGRACSQVIIPWQEFQVSEDGQCISRGLGACILDRSHIQGAVSELDMHGGRELSITELIDYLDDENNPLEALECSGFLEPIQRIAQESWPEVLGRTIWLPSNLCLLERYSVLASVFWSMTYTGFGKVSREGVAMMPDLTHSISDVLSFHSEYSEKMELFADLLNYNNWVNTIEAGELLSKNAC